MNRRARVVIILVALTAVSVWLLLPNNKARRAAERTRQSLRQQGFKLDLSKFDLPAAAGLGTDESLIPTADASRNFFAFRRLDVMRPVNSHSAMVTWKEEDPAGDYVTDYFWRDLRESLAQRNESLDRICEAVIAAPFRFKAVVETNGELRSDVLRARLLASAVAAQTMVALHDQNHSLAWTNLLALTRLVTAWQTEPLEISHFMRFRWLTMAQRVTWEALQANDWTDAELRRLQREWETPNFFSGLPETAALARASTAAFCSFQRQQPPPPGPTLREFISELFNSPNRAWTDATAGWRNARYRNYESYEDENAWLLYFRDCELDFRRAPAANSWSELRDLPSATNSRPAQARASLLGIEALRNMGPGTFGGFQRQAATLLARAAEAEARRRLVITAIAIQRFHLAKRRYPDSLAELEPDFLKTCPKDFMDGKPLRYRRIDDGRFLLYSVGMDCVDDHGQLLSESRPYPGGPGFGRPDGPDLVWPPPATSAEVQAYAQARENLRAPGPVQAMTPEGQTFRRYGSASPFATNRLNAPNSGRARLGF